MELIYWSCFLVLFWAYVGYPLFMRLRAARVADAAPTEEYTPPVTIVLAVRNEAVGVRQRIENLLDQDYPAERLELLVVCNGCTDDTEALATEAVRGKPRARVLISPSSEGKAGAVNVGVRQAQGEVVVFADGRQRFDPLAIRRLAEPFVDGTIGAVSGRHLVMASDNPAVQGVNVYWGLETQLRLSESRTGSVVGVTGAIYAVRREHFEPIPPNTLLDDVYVPMRIALKGLRVVLEPRALSFDVPAANHHQEYRRKLRTMAGNLQLLRIFPSLLSVRRNPLFFRYVSHKLLRTASPLFMLGMLWSALLVHQPLYHLLAAGQIAFYAVGVLGLILSVRAFGIPAAFVLVHTAVIASLFQLGAHAGELWVQVPRPASGSLSPASSSPHGDGVLGSTRSSKGMGEVR